MILGYASAVQAVDATSLSAMVIWRSFAGLTSSASNSMNPFQAGQGSFAVASLI